MRAVVLKMTVLAGLMAAASPSFAEDATQEGAKALADDLAIYLGQPAVDEGIVTVTPQDQAYQVQFDLTKAAGKLNIPDVTVTGGLVSFLAEPNSDGTWKVTSDALPPLSFKSTAVGHENEFSATTEGFSFDGTFDPKLGTFSTQTLAIDTTNVKIHSPTSSADVNYSGIKAEVTATGTSDLVSQKISETIKSLSETITGTDATTPMNIAVKLNDITGTGTLDNTKLGALRDLWAFLVAHASKDQIVAAQADVKTKLTAILPLWDGMAFDFSGSDFSVTTPMGVFGADKLSEKVSLSGVASPGKATFGLSFDGPHIPDGLVPPWGTPLLPSHLDISFGVSGNGLAEAANAIIADLDLSKDPPLPPEEGDKLSGFFMATPPTVTIDTSHVVAPSADITVSGTMVAAPPPATNGTVTIVAADFDKTVAALQTASQSVPSLQQAMMGIALVKGLAKTTADGKTSWTVEYGANGKVTINGQEFPMGGGQ